MTLDIAKQVAAMGAELNHLMSRSVADERLISLLQTQNEEQAAEIERLMHAHADEVRALKQERDVAVRKAEEVSGILNTAAHGITSGLRRMRGDETPNPIPDHPARTPSSVTRGLDHIEGGNGANSVFEMMPGRRGLPAVSP